MARRKSKSLSGMKTPEQDSGINPGKENQEMRSALVEIAVEDWRFSRALEKVLRRMDIMEAERFSRQYSYFSSRVAQALALAGLTCLDLSGMPFDPGMAVQGMNLEEFEEDESLIITRMVEPVILWNGRVIRTGMVMLGRAAGSDFTEE